MDYTTTASLTISTWKDIDETDIINIAKNQLSGEPPRQIMNEEGLMVDNPTHDEWVNMTIEKALEIIFDRLCKQPFAERIGQAIAQEAKREAEQKAYALGNAMSQYVSENMTFTK